MRKYFKKHPFSRAQNVQRNVDRVKSVMAECVAEINTSYEVGDLCSAFPRRMQEVIDGGGERLKY